MEYAYISTIGQDSHRFTDASASADRHIMLGGCKIPFDRSFKANSDGDVILHAITNAISGLTGVNILGGVADKLCLDEGIRDSRVYLEEAMRYLKDASIAHISLSVECLDPKLKEHIPSIKNSISAITGVPSSHIGLTATTGEGLTEFGRGEGVQVIAIVTFKVREE